jgi:chemotaxis protein CheD
MDIIMNLNVGVADMKVSNDPEAVLATYSLGSCIGIAIYDAVARVGGLLHYMLPESSLDPEKAKKNPCMFADTGIPALFKAAYKLGAKKQRIKVVIVGGSQILDQKGFFNIGRRNETAVRKMFHRNNVIIDYTDVGGVVNRTIKMAVDNGDVWLKVSGKGEKKI